MILSKSIFFKFLRYSLVGCVSTLIYFLSVFVLIELFHQDPVIGSAIAFVIMTIISFQLNKSYTFYSDFSGIKMMRFFIVSVIGFTLNVFIIYMMVHVLTFHYLCGELLTILIIPIINFILNNYWTFK
ncbi:GtrA family protein [Oceanobacillus salinisoli]|uniref:GtrA family protein n=1 Tax=Oceanobacillus salinisoli TaxID=2678611 RepID=UPI0012E0E4E6